MKTKLGIKETVTLTLSRCSDHKKSVIIVNGDGLTQTIRSDRDAQR
jgi:hypothetical protein